MKTIEMTAKTTEEAISAGLEQLGVSISDVKVDIIEEGSKGLFGLFGSRPAKVRLTLTEEDNSDEVHEIFANSLEDKAAKKPETKPAKKAEPVMQAEEPVAEAKPAKQNAPRAKNAPKKSAVKASAAENNAEKATEAKPKTVKAEAMKEKAPKPVTPAAQLDRDTMAGKAQDFLNHVIELMGIEAQVHMATDDEGFLRADLQGDTSGVLIGRHGETLDALQHLTSLYINKGKSEYTRITLDTENYRARREDTLVRLANRYASRAVKTGRRVSVEPMNPYERRIMHSALQENELVDTHSEGEEPNRHVVITPRKQDAPAKAEH